MLPPAISHFARFTRHGRDRPIVVRIDAVLAVEANVEGQNEHKTVEHKTVLHIGEPHPLRVTEALGTVLKRLGWPTLGEIEKGAD